MVLYLHSQCLTESPVLQMKFIAKNPALRVAANRYRQTFDNIAQMKKLLYLLLVIITIENSYSQKVNMILEVNDKVLDNAEISALYIEYGEEKYYVNYYPGDLILNEVVWAKIQAETQKKFYLHFNYRTPEYKDEIKSFKIEISKQHFEMPYLILNVYDFREKKYRKWYQYLTKENYITQISCPNCGMYVRMK